MIRGMEHFFCDENLRELGLCCLEKRRVWGEVGTFKKKKISRDCCKLTEVLFRLYSIKTFHNEGGETQTDCPERWQMPHSWKHSRSGWVSET